MQSRKMNPSSPGCMIPFTSMLLLMMILPGLSGQILTEAQRARLDVLSQPPPLASSLPPLVYSTPLPEDPVAWVDDLQIPASTFLRTTLEDNLDLITQTLIDRRKLELALAHRGIKLRKQDVQAELERMIQKFAPGKSSSEIAFVGANTIKQLERQARTNLGWKELYWHTHDVPADQRVPDVNPIILTFIRRQFEAEFETQVRGTEPGPSRRSDLFEVRHLPSRQLAAVGASEALDFLMGIAQQGMLKRSLESRIDTLLVDRALERFGVRVTEEEVARYSAVQDEQFSGSWIPREAVLSQQGLTKIQDNERWRRVEAWKRVAARDPSLRGELPGERNLQAFLEANRPYFMNESRRISHILIRTTDELTGLPYPDSRQADRQRRAELIYRKAVEGVDFAKLARLYSDDPMTARGDGRMSAEIKLRGGGMDPAIQEAVWEIEAVGGIHAPVKSLLGWHVIRLDEHKKPARTRPDFRKGGAREWLLKEYCIDRMESWLKRLRGQSRIRTVPDVQLFAYKRRTYYER